jgi:hypothetical protein
MYYSCGPKPCCCDAALTARLPVAQEFFEAGTTIPGEGFPLYNTWYDLFTGPQVSYRFKTGEAALVTLGCEMSANNGDGYMGFEVTDYSGAVVQAPAIAQSLAHAITTDWLQNTSRTFVVELPRSGIYTFAARFRAADPGDTDVDVLFAEPTISVQPVTLQTVLGRGRGGAGAAGARSGTHALSSKVEVMRQLVAKHAASGGAPTAGLKYMQRLVSSHDAEIAAQEAAAAAAAAEEAAAAEAAAVAAKAPKQPVRAAFKAAVYGPK